jgi:thymidine kinase
MKIEFKCFNKLIIQTSIMQVVFICAKKAFVPVYAEFEMAKAVANGKIVERINAGVNHIVIESSTSEVFIISNAQLFIGLREFILACEKVNKSVVIIFDDVDLINFEQNVLPAIPLCDTIIKGDDNDFTKQFNNAFPKIVLCTGPMRGGKSQEVLRLINQCNVLQMKILCLTPKFDERSGAKIKSRNGCETPSVSLEKLADIEENYYADAEVIVIDEAQFFPDLYTFVKRCKADGKSVFISGLDGDYNRKAFGEVLNCVPLCDKVTKFHALCMVKNDGTPALFSMLVADPALLKDGNKLAGDSQFLSVSREEYLNNANSHN